MNRQLDVRLDTNILVFFFHLPDVVNSTSQLTGNAQNKPGKTPPLKWNYVVIQSIDIQFLRV